MAIVRDKDAGPPLSDVSRWVLNQIKEVSKFLGMSFEGVEQQAIDLFMALEREMALQGSKQRHVRVHREVRNLKCDVNYDRSANSNGRKGSCSLKGT